MCGGLIIVLYFLMAYGLTNLLVNGRGPFNILGWFRNIAGYISKEFGRMLECMMCTSTNVGLLLSIADILLPSIAFTPFNILLPSVYWWLIIPFDMAITSGVVWIIDSIELWFEDKTIYIVNQQEEDNNKQVLHD